MIRIIGINCLIDIQYFFNNYCKDIVNGKYITIRIILFSALSRMQEMENEK